jgi:hypothetical protein
MLLRILIDGIAESAELRSIEFVPLKILSIQFGSNVNLNQTFFLQMIESDSQIAKDELPRL